MAFREKRKNGLLCRNLMNDDDSPPHHDGTCSTNVISNFSDSGDALKITFQLIVAVFSFALATTGASDGLPLAGPRLLPTKPLSWRGSPYFARSTGEHCQEGSAIFGSRHFTRLS